MRLSLKSPTERMDGGFSLLEVLCALGIMAVAFVVLFTFSANTMKLAGRAKNITIATMLAKQKMTDIEIDLNKEMKKGEFPDERESDGEFEDPYSIFKWKMAISRVELPAPKTGKEGGIQEMVAGQLTKEIGLRVRELKLTVSWNEKDKERSFDLITHIVKEK